MADEPQEITHPNGSSFVHDTVFDVFANDKLTKKQQQQKQQQQQQEKQEQRQQQSQQPLVYKKVSKTNFVEPYVDRMVILRGNETKGNI